MNVNTGKGSKLSVVILQRTFLLLLSVACLTTGFGQSSKPADDIPIRRGTGGCAANGGIPLLSTESDVANVLMEIGMGRRFDGSLIPAISLRESKLTADIYTPEALGYPTASRDGGVELIPEASLPRRTSGKLYKLIDGTFVPPYTIQPFRQVKAPEIFMDIVRISRWDYELRFYRPADVGPKRGGLYVVSGAPLVIYKFKNPNPPAINGLQISTIKNGFEDRSEYFYDEQLDLWKLTRNGEEITHRRSIINPQNPCERIETQISRKGGSTRKQIRVFRGFPWGQAVVKKVEDADGEALVTTYTYFEKYGGPHYSFLKTITHPDGRVEYRNQLTDPNKGMRRTRN